MTCPAWNAPALPCPAGPCHPMPCHEMLCLAMHESQSSCLLVHAQVAGTWPMCIYLLLGTRQDIVWAEDRACRRSVTALAASGWTAGLGSWRGCRDGRYRQTMPGHQPAPSSSRLELRARRCPKFTPSQPRGCRGLRGSHPRGARSAAAAASTKPRFRGRRGGGAHSCSIPSTAGRHRHPTWRGRRHGGVGRRRDSRSRARRKVSNCVL